MFEQINIFFSLCHSRRPSAAQKQFLQSTADREPGTVCLGSTAADVSCLPDLGGIFVVVGFYLSV